MRFYDSYRPHVITCLASCLLTIDAEIKIYLGIRFHFVIFYLEFSIVFGSVFDLFKIIIIVSIMYMYCNNNCICIQCNVTLGDKIHVTVCRKKIVYIHVHDGVHVHVYMYVAGQNEIQVKMILT